jgi:hypothetical protein
MACQLLSTVSSWSSSPLSEIAAFSCNYPLVKNQDFDIFMLQCFKGLCSQMVICIRGKKEHPQVFKLLADEEKNAGDNGQHRQAFIYDFCQDAGKTD